MAKWAARIALGLSNSAPGLLLSLGDILYEPDIGNPPIFVANPPRLIVLVSEQGSDMTDGAGLINKAGLRLLLFKFNWEVWPTAIQMRVLGAKVCLGIPILTRPLTINLMQGLLVQHPTNTEELPRVWLRPSLIKIKYPKDEPLDPTMLIIDVLRSSHAKTPCRLSVETIINLSENGVPPSAFLDLLKQGLDELVTPLLAWDGQKAMSALWCTLRRLGGVMTARRAREDVGLARVKGHLERDAEEVGPDDEDGFQQLDALEQRSSAWWNDETSGCPSTLEETVMYLLDSGFTPENCAVLKDKLEKIVKSCINNYIRSYRIEMPMSATAFLVPGLDIDPRIDII